MAVLRKNIWLVFWILLISCVLLVFTMTWVRWQHIQQYYSNAQTALVEKWYGSFLASLEQQEGILTLMGEDLLLRQRTENVQQRLENIQKINPELFAGFALISADGSVLELTSNLQSNNLPNLLEAPQTRDSFMYTLSTDKMVLGRTYEVNRLVIPARKAIRDEEGSVLGVMTGALLFDTKDSLLGRFNVLGDFNRISVVRSRDQFYQYSSHVSSQVNFYDIPMSDDEFSELVVVWSTGSPSPMRGSLKEIRPILYSRDTKDGRGYVFGTALYNDRYEFWLISEIERSYLFRELLLFFLWVLFATSTFLGVMFWLVRMIDRADKVRLDDLEYQANHDHLTGILNRNYLITQFSSWKEGKHKFSLMYIDIDNFKGINDHFGHQVGDNFLIHFSEVLTDALDNRGIVVRHGGDEFVLLILSDNLSAAEAEILGKVFKACENLNLKGNTFSASLSVGIAHYPEHGLELDEVMRAADIAIYEAKKIRNTTRVFNSGMESKYMLLTKIEQNLRGAEKRGEISINYQPQVDCKGNLHGVEALVRWHSPELGFVPPDQFISIAEKSGMMIVLGDYIIDQALSEISTIQHELGFSFGLSINVSVKQLVEIDFQKKICDKINRSGIKGVNISIEITESILIDDFIHVRKILEEIKDNGISISLDDFGTGYSSLSILRYLPLDEIKIDKSFVDHLLEDKTALQMVRNIVSIGRNYNVRLLAEGIETHEQLECLNEIGCDFYQGYLFSKPLSSNDLRLYLRNYNEERISKA